MLLGEQVLQEELGQDIFEGKVGYPSSDIALDVVPHLLTKV